MHIELLCQDQKTTGKEFVKANQKIKKENLQTLKLNAEIVKIHLYFQSETKNFTQKKVGKTNLLDVKNVDKLKKKE